MSIYRMINPHFDDGLLVWSDDYSGRYQPIDYDIQFDCEWKLFLDRQPGFHQHTGVDTCDAWIDDRIYELTGVSHYIQTRRYGSLMVAGLEWIRNRTGKGQERRDVGGRLILDPKFSIGHFRGKDCLDVGCGAGRWTRTLLALGAKVKSVDVSAHGLKSTKRFNDDVEYLNLFDILETRPDIHRAYNFTICWGVIMCTHDPKLAFRNIAATARPGGELYTMTYCPGYHDSLDITNHRKHYHRNLTTKQEKLEYAYKISDIRDNCINQLDMLNTFYNWVVPEEVVYGWYEENGFSDVLTLNSAEKYKCANHILGRRLE